MRLLLTTDDAVRIILECRKGRTQQSVAADYGASQTTIGKICQGIHHPEALQLVEKTGFAERAAQCRCGARHDDT
jgi:hypothetical protein